MKTLYLDIFSGISGDMFIAALLDLGVDFQLLERELARLPLDGYHLHISRQHKAGIAGIKFDVHLEGDHHHLDSTQVQDQQHGHDDHEHRQRAASPLHPQDHQHGHDAHDHPGHHEHPHLNHANTHDEEHAQTHHLHDHAHSQADHDHAHGRTFAEIKLLLSRSPLSDWVKEKAMAVFQRIADAEGTIHGRAPDEVHFHEVGAIDSIVDIVGACLALEMLGKPQILAAPVVEGTGWIDCAHGRFPIPAPATLEIFRRRGISFTQCDEPHELVTPTGAALLAEFVKRFGPMQGLTPLKIGFGLGTRENKTRPNVLRAIWAEVNPGQSENPATGSQPAHDWETDTIAVLETNLDNISAEILGHFVERAFALGALDVFHTPIQMKKNRPGVLLTVLCASSEADNFTELMLRETSALGVRRSLTERRKLQRKTARVQTPYGHVTVKLGLLDGKIVQVSPEFESCKKLAAAAQVPLKQVYEAASKAAPDMEHL